MQTIRRAWPATPLVALLLLTAIPGLTAEPCSAFTWDVSRELALFAGAATPLTAGADSAAAPLVSTDQLYSLTLRPQGEVTFLAAPGKRNSAASGYAGLATLDIKTPGKYRVSLDAPVWIDVVANGAAMDSAGHQGAMSCGGPRKIVEFEFAVARRVTLQFSAADLAAVRVAITPSR